MRLSGKRFSRRGPFFSSDQSGNEVTTLHLGKPLGPSALSLDGANFQSGWSLGAAHPKTWRPLMGNRANDSLPGNFWQFWFSVGAHLSTHPVYRAVLLQPETARNPNPLQQSPSRALGCKGSWFLDKKPLFLTWRKMGAAQGGFRANLDWLLARLCQGGGSSSSLNMLRPGSFVSCFTTQPTRNKDNRGVGH